MYIRILDPLELRNNRDRKSICENKRSMNYREVESILSGRPDDDDIITSLKSDVNVRETV